MNTPANIPFSWENTPGVRKDPCHENLAGDRWRVAVHDNSSTGERRRVGIHDNSSTEEGRLPPPPCVSQPRLRSSSRRSKDDDPFLMAYKECTKSNKKVSLTSPNKREEIDVVKKEAHTIAPPLTSQRLIAPSLITTRIGRN
ncbi:hypothetical protein L1987_51121 [Smallanthus sonchifolius]|uniref:Uncharacterized protein n=1 Tax=Smallanthus sonchifolius TaxID=185202 RepID=A0ACB9EQJ8_9ASTR|nr:hypothetical protein L1987_51121 [Smallanthus sonchifolius]